MDERRRHMETAYRIDLLARIGITLMLPLGLQMGYYWVSSFYGGYKQLCGSLEFY